MGQGATTMGNYISANEWWRIHRANKTFTSISKVRTRCWSVTISLDQTDLETVKQHLEELAKNEPEGFAACFSEEEGKKKDDEGQGYRHCQMAVYWTQPQTGNKLMKLFNKTFKAHIEPAMSQSALCDYVQKSDTHVSGPYKYGTWDDFERECKEAKKKQGKRNDLVLLEEAITSGMTYTELMNDPTLNKMLATKRNWVKDRIAAWQFDQWATRNRSLLGNGMLSVDYIYGETGRGKTQLIRQIFGYAKSVFSISKKSQYESRFAFNMYEGQTILLLDEYRSSFPFQTLLDVLYGNPYDFETKGGAGWGGWLKVFICSPIPISKQYTGKVNQLNDQDGSICQLYRRLSCGRVIELKEEFGKPKLPYASAEDCMMGKWDDSIYPSKSIEEATEIDWRTGQSLLFSENRTALEAAQQLELNDDDDDEEW